MRVFQRSKFQRRIVMPLILTCFLSGCYKWVTLEPPVEQAIAEHNGKVRITLEDGRRVEFDSAPVADEFWHRRAQRDTAFSEVAKAEVRKTNVVGTVGVLLGAIAGYVVLCEASFAC